MDPATRTLLQDMARRESRSLMQYAREAFPWTTPEERQALTQLQQVAEEDRQGAGALLQFLARRGHTFPYLGPYPMAYTSLNNVSLGYLLPMLVTHEKQAIADLERDRTALTDEEALLQIEKIVTMKHRHLQTLEALAAAHSETASTIR